MSSNFPLLIYDENLLNKHSNIIRQKKQPIFLFLSLAVKSLHHLHKNLWRIITLLSPSCVKFITRSAICGYRNFASKLLSTSKNTLKISPNKKNSLSNLNLCINQAGNVQWPTRSHFNIITAAKQLLKRVKGLNFESLSRNLLEKSFSI